jgi:hypothetical protein
MAPPQVCTALHAHSCVGGSNKGMSARSHNLVGLVTQPSALLPRLCVGALQFHHGLVQTVQARPFTVTRTRCLVCTTGNMWPAEQVTCVAPQRRCRRRPDQLSPGVPAYSSTGYNWVADAGAGTPSLASEQQQQELQEECSAGRSKDGASAGAPSIALTVLSCVGGNNKACLHAPAVCLALLHS